MTAEWWLAGAGLLITIMITGGGIIWKLSEVKASIMEEIVKHRDELDAEVSMVRLAAYEEYKTLRREANEVSAQTYREFGESVAAVREKLNQVEIWVRDQFSLHLLKADYERGQDQILDALKRLGEGMDRRFSKIEEKFDSREKDRRDAHHS